MSPLPLTAEEARTDYSSYTTMAQASSTTTAPANSPIVLFSGGIPIAPADLDFGNSITQAQINALSSFSRMVNAIPSTGDLWVPTGSQTWDIYSIALTNAEFAQTSQGVVPSTMLFTTRQAVVAESGATVNVVEPVQQVIDDAPSSLAALGEHVSPWLEQIGFQFIGFQFSKDSAIPSFKADVSGPPPSPSLSDTQPTGLSSMFLQLRAHLASATMTDTLGNSFYATPLYPANFYQPQYDSSWKSFEITPGQNDPWAPVSNGGKVTGEMATIPLQRSWWSTWIFSNRGWEFAPSTGFGPLSDGGNPPQGMMPMYASAVIFARNIEVVSAPGSTAATSFTARNADAAQAAQTAGQQFGSQTANDSSSMLIIGFVCTPLPQCPNPDPKLNWGS